MAIQFLFVCTGMYIQRWDDYLWCLFFFFFNSTSSLKHHPQIDVSPLGHVMRYTSRSQLQNFDVSHSTHVIKLWGRLLNHNLILGCCGRVSSTCFSSSTRCVTLTNLVKSHDWENEGIVIRTNGIHLSSFVRQIFLNK